MPSVSGGAKTSLHENGLPEVLALAEALGECPAHRLLIGVQPVEPGRFGARLHAAVQRQIGPAIEMALACLQRLGALAVQPPCGRGTADEH